MMEAISAGKRLSGGTMAGRMPSSGIGVDKMWMMIFRNRKDGISLLRGERNG